MKNRRYVHGNLHGRIALILLFLLVCLGMGIARSETTYAKTYKVRTAKDWKNISKYKGGTFKIMKNINLTSTAQYLTINKNKKYTIDLNGHKVATTYKGASLRTACPLVINKGTVILKSSKKNKGVFYSTETAAITVGGKAKFYLKSGAVVDDAVEFRSDITSAIFITQNATGYIQGNSIIQSIGNGIVVQLNGKLYVTGSPYVRAGANNYTGMFTHYGCGIAVQGTGCKLSLKGGSFGTKASYDATLTTPVSSYNYAMSGSYPVLDIYGKVLTTEPGYKYVDATGATVPIKGSNLDDIYPWFSATYGGEKKLTTKVTDGQGYYTVYVVPA